MRYQLIRGLLITCMLLLPLPLWVAELDTPATIEVVGRGTVSQRPDRAVLTFAVETNATDANEAIRQNAVRAEKLIAMLKENMDASDRIVTTQIQLRPVYDQKLRITPSTYRVNNTVRLETGQVTRLGAIIDAAAKSGSGRIGELRFSHSQEDELARKAAALAVTDARRIADALAQAAGVKILRLHRIRYTGTHHPVPMRAEMRLAAGATPIEIGDLTIAQQVTAIFLIE